MSAQAEHNLMGPSNLGIVMGPNLVEDPDIKAMSPQQAMRAMELAKRPAQILEACPRKPPPPSLSSSEIEIEIEIEPLVVCVS